MAIEPYKGVRDFYPGDERIQKYIFSAMRRAVEAFGYEEINASLLEPTDLYRAKTSEEIVTQQTYTFLDRGDRSVTLRPEMTPTVARMVATKKRELGFPLRWYSLPNLFRYERPQRGRLREHWQLNVDLFGVTGIEADIEIIEAAHRVMRELGATDDMFVIRINSRAFLDTVYDSLNIPSEKRHEMTRLLDAKDKGASVPEELLAAIADTHSFPYFEEIRTALAERGVANVVIDSTIARGFDYYTGMVFEVFDTHADNTRSLFGGGRYDNLVGNYGKEQVAAVGFGMGDVTARDFLETHNLLPALPPTARLYLAPVTKADATNAARMADTLRSEGLAVAFGMGHEKIGDHIKAAAKLAIPFFAAFGEKEFSENTLTIKNLATGEEKNLPAEEVARYCKAL